MLDIKKKITNTEKEQYFAEFLWAVACELDGPHNANILIEENGRDIVLYVDFYEKKVFKKEYKEALIVKVNDKGDIVFSGKSSKAVTFRKDSPLRFLKYQVARALDHYYQMKTNFSSVVLKKYYHDDWFPVF